MFECNFFKNKSLYYLGHLNACLLIFPFRVLPIFFDKYIKYEGYSVTLVAKKIVFMLNFKGKINYLFYSAVNYFNKVECPYFHQSKANVIDRKYLVTRLFESNNCHLYFRHPIDKIDKSV